MIQNNLSYTGISLPFRVGNSGGVVMSSTAVEDATHIIEGIKQLLCTSKFERRMNKDFYSEVETSIFEPEDLGLSTLLQFQVKEALTFFDEVIDVISVTPTMRNEKVFVSITFNLKIYDTQFITLLEVN